MTITSPSMQRRAGLLALALCLAPAAAMAWQQRTPTQAPPVNYNTIQTQQANQQAILTDKLQTNQLLERQRQRNAAAIRRPVQNTPGATPPLDLSNQAQQDRFNARQRDVVDQYRAASASSPLVLPQPLPQPPPKKNANTNPPPAQQGQPQR